MSKLWYSIQELFYRLLDSRLSVTGIITFGVVLKSVAELLRKKVDCNCILVDEVLKGKFADCRRINDRSNGDI
jgi:hypothetical protein